MKFIKYAVVIAIFIFSALSVFAGYNAGTIITATSDCDTVTVTYNLEPYGGADFVFNSSVLAASVDVPDVLGTATVTFAINPQANGTTINLNLDNAGGFNFDSTTIVCATDVTAIEVNYIDDGRVEPFASNMVIYPLDDGIRVYSDEGELMLFIPVDSIEMLGVPDEEPRLLGETLDGYVQVYRLNDGRYQVLVGPDGEGKVHVATWEGLGFVPRDSIETDTFIVE